MCFLKKALSWLLIFQYLNTSVLYADIASTSIIFENPSLHGRAHTKQLLTKSPEVYNPFPSLKVVTASSSGVERTLFNSSLDSKSFSGFSSLGLQSSAVSVAVVPQSNSIKISSTLKGGEFSLHIKPDGTIHVQKMKLLNSLSLETSGNIHFDSPTKADRLSLKGKNIFFSRAHSVNHLLTSGQVKNTTEGRLFIGESADIQDGNFVNEGRIDGSHGSAIDMHGGDFTNQFVGMSKASSFRTQINWSGDFSINNVGAFLNETSFIPKAKSTPGQFAVSAESFLNRGKVSGHSLYLQTSGDFTNLGNIYAKDESRIQVNGFAVNQGNITINSTLRMRVAGDLLVGEGSTIRAHRLAARVGGHAENRGLIDLGTLSLRTDFLSNHGQIHLKGKSSIEGGENSTLTNYSEAEILSSGGLHISGGGFKNLAQDERRGKVEVQGLDLTAEEAENSGDLKVNGPSQFQVDHFTNHPSALVQLTDKAAFNVSSLTNLGTVTGDSISISVSDTFTNGVDALISTLETFSVFGGEITNLGKIISQALVSISPIATSSDLLPVAARLYNQGTLVGADLQIQVDELENDGDITALKALSVIADRAFKNFGSVSSNEYLEISALLTLLNVGTVESLVGQMALSTLEFLNKGEVQAKDGSLRIEIDQGKNQGKILGLQAVAMRIGTAFLNTVGDGTSPALVESSGDVVFEGKGEVQNTGTMTAVEDIRLDVGVTNSGRILAGQLLTSTTSGQEFTNQACGEIMARKSFELSNTEHFENLGQIQSGAVAIKTAGSFLNEGMLVAESGDAVLQLSRGENAGHIRANQKLSLTLEGDFKNNKVVQGTQLNITSKGLWHNTSNGEISAQRSVAIKAVDLINDGEIFSEEGDVSLRLEQGYNAGTIQAKAQTSIHAGNAFNNAGSLIGNELDLLSKKKWRNTSTAVVRAWKSLGLEAVDFTNAGLVSAPRLNLIIGQGSNTGKSSDSKGILATDSLELSVKDDFQNDGSLFAENSIKFQGGGLGKNGSDGTIETKGLLTSSLVGFDNQNIIKADKGLDFDGLSQPFRNMGNIVSDSDMTFNSTDSLVNEGFIQSAAGTVSFTLGELINHKLISALQGVLKIRFQRGENHNLLFGYAGIELTIDEIFTNLRVVGQELGLIESPGSITFSGNGRFFNEAFVRGGENLSIGVDVENKGLLHADESVLSSQDTKDFSNGLGAAVQAKKKVSLQVSALENKGEVKAEEVSLTSSGEFSNSGKLFAKKLLLFLRGGANLSSGTMSGSAQLTLTLGNTFDNYGQLFSPILRAAGGGVFQNHREGVVRGEDLLSIEQTGLLNDGSILSQKSVDLVGSPRPVENRASGKIISGGTLRITEVTSLHSAGQLHGKTGVELSAVNLDAGGEIVSPEGSIVVSSTKAHVKPSGVIDARGPVRFTTEHSLQIEGRSRSGSTLHLMGNGSVTNHGSVFATDAIDITQALTNTASGQIDTKGTLSLRGRHSVANSGHMAGTKGITADLSTLENSGAFLASHGPVNLTIGTGRNTGILTASQRDTISGKTLTLNIRDKFHNQGDLHGEDAIVLGGSGTFLNSGQLLSGGSVVLQSSRTQNSGQVQAETHIRFANKATIENTTAGRIVAKSQVLAEASATVTNLGAVLSEGTIEFKQPSYVNDGRLEAKGHISFPQSESLENRTAGVIISQGGGVLFPRLKTFMNHGQLSSHANLTFHHLSTFINTGKLHTVQDLSVSTPGDFVAQGQFMGQQKLSFQIAGTFTNRATLQSDGNLSVSGTQLALHSPLMGKKGVTLHATSGLTSHPGAIIHSSEGIVKLTGHSVSNSQGKVIGQSIEVHSQGAPFVDHGTLDSQNGLKLHTPHGWHLDSTPRSFPHSISIHGPIVGTGSLKVDGDITWSTPRGLTNESDVQATGFIELTVPDHFKHLGKLIGKKGFKLKLKSLHNAGVLYGGGDSTLLIEQYFDNLKYFRVDGALSLQVVAAARMAAIEAIGHVNVDDIIVKEGVYDFYGPDADRKGLYHQVHIKKDWVRYWGNDDDNIKKFLFERKGLAPKKTQIIKKELIGSDGREVPYNGFYKAYCFKPWGKRDWFFHRYALHYSFVDSDAESKLAFPGSSMVWKSSGLRLAGHEMDREGVLERQIRRKKGDRWKKNKNEQIHFWTTDTRKIRLFLSRKLDIDPSQIRIDRTETLGHEDHILTPQELQRQDIYRQGHGYARGGTRDWFFHAYEVHYSYLKEVDNPLATRFTNHPGAQFEQRGTQKHVNMIVDGKVLNHGGHMILEGKTTSRSRSFTNRSQSPQQPALFYGGSATFLTKTLENVSGVLSANNLLQYVGEELANRKGRISSRDKLVMHVTGKRSNTGAIRGNDVTLKAPALHDVYGAATPTGAATVKSQDSLAGYFDAEGSGSIPLSDKKDKGFVLIPSFESSIPDQDEIDYQINLRYIDDAEKGKLTIQDFVEWTQFLNGGKPIEIMPDFWEPAPEHVANYKHALVPANLTVLPPQIAAFDHPKLRQGVKPRLQFHPHLASDLLRKSLMNSIGFTTISSHIQSPELLLRVLETEGYIEARQAHGLPALPAPHGWDQLTTQQQLARQLKELVSVSDVERFNNPAIVYRLLQDHGELVLSAVMTYPPHIREAFQAVFGKVTANYLHLASTHGSITTVEPVMARKGVSLTSARNLKTHDVYSGGDVVVDVEEDYQNVGTVMGHKGDIKAKAKGTLTNNATFEGEGVEINAGNFVVEPLMQRDNLKGGYHEKPISQSTVISRSEKVIVTADKDITFKGAHVKGQKGISLLSDTQFLGSQVETTHIDRPRHSSHTETHHKSRLEAPDGDIEDDGEKRIVHNGADMVSGKSIFVQAPELEDINVANTHEESKSKKNRKGLSKTKSKTSQSSREVIPNVKEAENSILHAGSQKHVLRSTDMKSKTKTLVRSQECATHIESDISSYTTQRSQETDSGVWKSGSHMSKSSQTLEISRFGGPVEFDTPKGVVVQVPGKKTHLRNGKVKSTDSRPLNEILDEEQEKPGMAWIKPLRSRNDVLWEPINEIHHISKSSHKGLTTGGAVVIGVVMGVVTGGLGAATILGSTTLAAMASAGAGSLLTQTAVSLINNQGDVRKAMKDLASTDTVVSMATAMATAGVMDGVFGGGEEATTAGEGATKAGERATTVGEGASPSAATPSPTTASPAGGASQAASGGTRSILDMSTLEKFQHHLPRTALNMGTATGCHMAVEGKMPSAKGLVQNAVQAVAQSVAHTCANEIGGFYVDNDVDIVSHKLLHGALGAGLGAAVSKNRTEGAIVGAGSAMAAELIAEMMGPSTADLDRKAQAGVVTQADWDAYFEEARYSANTARILVTTLTAFMGKDAEVAIITADNALANNYEMHAVIQKAETGSEEEFVEWFLEDWESEHGALTPDEQERLIRQLQRTYYSIKVNGFHHDLLNPGMKRFEEMAALSFDEFREQWLANEDPAKLATPEARRAAERIIIKQYDFYRMKSIDLAVGSVIGLVAGVRGSLSSPARQSMTAASPGSIRGAPKGVVVAQDVKALKLKSSAGFDARFKKSVGFADDIGAPLEFRATYDPHKPGFTVVETPTHSVKTSAVANQNRASSGTGEHPHALLPGEGKVGTFSELSKLRVKGDHLTPHHIPQSAFMKQFEVNRNDGVAILMEQPFPGKGGRHRQTRTYGKKPNLSERPRDELATDIRDVRKIYMDDQLYKSEIRESLQEVVQKNKDKFPQLFNKSE